MAPNGEQPPLPSIVSETLQLPRGSESRQLTEESAARLKYEIWDVLQFSHVGETPRVTVRHLNRMQDICTKFPTGEHFHTLGALHNIA